MKSGWKDADFAKYQQTIERALSQYNIPEHMREGVVAYIMTGRATGSFLQAVLSNNLNAAVSRADDYNQSALVNYVKFLHNHAPLGCFGSEGAVDYWKNIGGMLGQMAKDQN